MALTSCPGQIFNCDETGLPLTHQPPKAVARVGQKHPYTVTSNDKAQITVLACGSAAGYSIPPMVIFDRKSLKPEMTIGEVPSTFYGLSDNGVAALYFDYVWLTDRITFLVLLFSHVVIFFTYYTKWGRG